MVREYIRQHWGDCIRVKGKSNEALDLPYTYTSPCYIGLFDELYYWDTYFINKGLIQDGRLNDVKNNILNFVYLINKFGYIPNAASNALLNRSQMPLFIMMCDDYYEATKDLSFIKDIFPAMVKEYNFWMENRSSINGLNHFGNNATKEFKEFFFSEYENRVKNVIHKNEFSKEEVGDNAMAECESGWDFSPRFNQNALAYNPIDLNSILYENELILSKFSKLLSKEDIYFSKSEKRKQLINEYMFKNNCFYDYNYINNTQSDVVTCAAFLPFIFNISNDKNALLNILSKLEFEKGISTGENKTYDALYQWFYPNMWPNLVLFAYEALKNNKCNEEANRIAKKYIDAVDYEFKLTGKLWEKYDARTGRKSTVNEYQETEMLGWTAGVYCVLFDELAKEKK